MKTARFALSLIALAAAIPALADWRDEIRHVLPTLGHRNWLVVADSAYPAQTSPGITTITADVSQEEAVSFVLKQLGKAKHVYPIIHLDKELDFVPEADAPGVTAYRNSLKGMVAGKTVKKELHEDIIRMLGEAGADFKVVILKTNFTVPYTSVFCQLDCAYWGPAKEARMRKNMPKKN